MKIGGFLGLSTIDYPGKLAAVIFTQGCNYRCPYCQNISLIPSGKSGSIESRHIFNILEKRKSVLEGIVITGGEPTLQRNLFSFMSFLKTLKYKLKLDTNGSRPEVLDELISCGLVDYIAIDFKSWYNGYRKLSGGDVYALEKVLHSVDLVSNYNIAMEIRTTCDKRFVDVDVIRHISLTVKKYPNLSWFLQKVRPPGEPCLDLGQLVKIAKKNISSVYQRSSGSHNQVLKQPGFLSV